MKSLAGVLQGAGPDWTCLICSGRDKAVPSSAGIPCLIRPNSAPSISKASSLSRKHPGQLATVPASPAVLPAPTTESDVSFARRVAHSAQIIGNHDIGQRIAAGFGPQVQTLPTHEMVPVSRKESDGSCLQSSLGTPKVLACYDVSLLADSASDLEDNDVLRIDEHKDVLEKCANDLRESAETRLAAVKSEDTPLQSRSREDRHDVLGALKDASIDCASIVLDIQDIHSNEEIPSHGLRHGTSRHYFKRMSSTRSGKPSPKRKVTPRHDDQEEDSQTTTVSRHDLGSADAEGSDSDSSSSSNSSDSDVDKRYVRLQVAERIQHLRECMDEQGVSPAKNDVPRVPGISWSEQQMFAAQQDKAHLAAQVAEVRTYQAAMRVKLTAMGADNWEGRTDFVKTKAPTEAVCDAMARYHEHSGRLGRMYPMSAEELDEECPKLEVRDEQRLQVYCEDLKGNDLERAWPGQDGCTEVLDRWEALVVARLSATGHASLHPLWSRLTARKSMQKLSQLDAGLWREDFRSPRPKPEAEPEGGRARRICDMVVKGIGPLCPRRR